MRMICTLEEYLKHPAVGSSSIKTLIDRSPAHYIYDRLNPRESTPAQRYGTIIHKAILEPEEFNKNSVVEPEFAGTGSRAAKDKWHLENHGKLILKRDQLDDIRGMLKSVSMHKQAFKYVSAGRAEESIFWVDPVTGVECKARPDFVLEKHVLVDVKTTEDASYSAFQKTIANYGYHIQAAFYLDGASQVFETRFDEFVIMAVEKSPPYAINCFLLDEGMIEEGRALYYNALKVLKECQDTKQYPAYPSELSSMTLPSWAYKIGGENE